MGQRQQRRVVTLVLIGALPYNTLRVSVHILILILQILHKHAEEIKKTLLAVLVLLGGSGTRGTRNEYILGRRLVVRYAPPTAARPHAHAGLYFWGVGSVGAGVLVGVVVVGEVVGVVGVEDAVGCSVRPSHRRS